MSKPKVYFIHEAFKHLGTNNWTVRETDTKPPRPIAYPNDWIALIEKSAYDKAIEALREAKDNLEETGLSLDGQDLRIRIDNALGEITEALMKLGEV